LAPVGITYAWVAWIQDARVTAFYILIGSLSLFVGCLLVLLSAQKSLPASTFKAKSIEASDHENTAFLLLYVMPLFTSQFNTLDWEFWVPTVIIFAVITATGYNYHFNPMLGLLGWHFYKVESQEGVTFVLITKKQIRTASTELKVGQLTEYMLLDLEER
jgi:cobalamin synthase